MIYLQLLWSFVQIGLFSIGGGYAAMPLIQNQVVDIHGWLTMNQFADIMTIAEMTPGPIAINAATFVGHHVGGFWGAFCATLGVILPSFAIIAAISYVLQQFEALRAVKYAFLGIRAGVLALILRAFWTMARQIPRKAVSCGIAAAAFVLAALLKLNVLIVIVLCAAAGLIASLAAERRAK